MDTVSQETRSRIMASIRGRDTEPERLLRSALFARGFRYRINSADLPGKPDLKLSKHRAVVFVNGCFWHGHDCRYFRRPTSNQAFWDEKIRKNRERDLRNVRDLRTEGWRVCIVWECLIRSIAFSERRSELIDLIGEWIEGDAPFLEVFGAKSTQNTKIRYADLGKNEDDRVFAAEREGRYEGSRR